MSENKNKILFQVAVLHHDKEGTTEVVAPKTVLAKSAETARLAVIREVGEEYDEKLDELQVIVKDFR